MNQLSEFISTERERYSEGDNNLFAFSLGQAAQYLDFLAIIADRQKVASRRMVANSKKLMESQSRSGPVTDEQMKMLEEGSRLFLLVQLETESFYLFAKLLVDKLAFFLQDYFGPARGISLRSHDKFTKSHIEYGIAKGLIYPGGFAQSLKFLKENVCDYRDKQISHLQSLRSMKGTLYQANGETRWVTTQLSPKEEDRQTESKELPQLMQAISDYIQQVIEIVSLNRAKTRYKFKEQ